MRFKATVSKGTVTFGFEALNEKHAALLADKFYAERNYEVFDIEGVPEDSEAGDNNEKK